jgi:hypothetical protein
MKAMSSYHRHRLPSDHRQTRQRRRTNRENAKYCLCLADCLWGDNPSTEGSPLRTDSGTGIPEYLGVRRRGYGRLYLGVRYSAGFGCVCSSRTPSAISSSGGSDSMEAWRPTKNLPYSPLSATKRSLLDVRGW